MAVDDVATRVNKHKHTTVTRSVNGSVHCMKMYSTQYMIHKTIIHITGGRVSSDQNCVKSYYSTVKMIQSWLEPLDQASIPL